MNKQIIILIALLLNSLFLYAQNSGEAPLIKSRLEAPDLFISGSFFATYNLIEDNSKLNDHSVKWIKEKDKNTVLFKDVSDVRFILKDRNGADSFIQKYLTVLSEDGIEITNHNINLKNVTNLKVYNTGKKILDIYKLLKTPVQHYYFVFSIDNVVVKQFVSTDENTTVTQASVIATEATRVVQEYLNKSKVVEKATPAPTVKNNAKSNLPRPEAKNTNVVKANNSLSKEEKASNTPLVKLSKTETQLEYLAKENDINKVQAFLKNEKLTNESFQSRYSWYEININSNGKRISLTKSNNYFAIEANDNVVYYDLLNSNKTILKTSRSESNVFIKNNILYGLSKYKYTSSNDTTYTVSVRNPIDFDPTNYIVLETPLSPIAKYHQQTLFPKRKEKIKTGIGNADDFVINEMSLADLVNLTAELANETCPSCPAAFGYIRDYSDYNFGKWWGTIEKSEDVYNNTFIRSSDKAEMKVQLSNTANSYVSSISTNNSDIYNRFKNFIIKNPTIFTNPIGEQAKDEGKITFQLSHNNKKYFVVLQENKNADDSKFKYFVNAFLAKTKNMVADKKIELVVENKKPVPVKTENNTNNSNSNNIIESSNQKSTSSCKSTITYQQNKYREAFRDIFNTISLQSEYNSLYGDYMQQCMKSAEAIHFAFSQGCKGLNNEIRSKLVIEAKTLIDWLKGFDTHYQAFIRGDGYGEADIKKMYFKIEKDNKEIDLTAGW
jgi:hypothetical protein